VGEGGKTEQESLIENFGSFQFDTMLPAASAKSRVMLMRLLPYYEACFCQSKPLSVTLTGDRYLEFLPRDNSRISNAMTRSGITGAMSDEQENYSRSGENIFKT
jgi:hypothetical protein